MAAMHPDYHQPSDELDKVNWEKMLNIINVNGNRLSHKPELIKSTDGL